MKLSVYLIWTTLSLLLACVLQLLELPDAVSALRPMWPALLVGFWAYVLPRSSLLPVAWLIGIGLDVLFGTILGQHALALAVIAFLCLKLSGLLRLLKAWQGGMVMLPIWAGYSFLLFWMDGTTGHDADPWMRWLPILSTALLWVAMAALWRNAMRLNHRD